MIFRAITLQEANVFLPIVKERFSKIHTLVAEGQLLHDALNKSEQEVTISNADGTQEISDSEKFEERVVRKRLHEIEQQVRNEVIELQAFGAIVKSVFPARVDFLSERHKQPVYLCWQTGDKQVSHWHPIDESFTTRRFINQPQAFGPMVVH